MTSTPPPMPKSQSPSRMFWAVVTMACSPDEQRRFTAMATDSMGRPAWIEARRATYAERPSVGMVLPTVT